MSNRARILYIGVTNDLERRVSEHREGAIPGFTQKYHLDRLIYFEVFERMLDAIAREKQLKGWRREKKLQLIETVNPNWSDLDWSLNQKRFA